MKKSELRQIIKEEFYSIPNSHETIDNAVNQEDLSQFIEIGSVIMQDLTTKFGFDATDVHKYLYNVMLNNI